MGKYKAESLLNQLRDKTDSYLLEQVPLEKQLAVCGDMANALSVPQQGRGR